MAKYFRENQQLGLHFNALVFAISCTKRELATGIGTSVDIFRDHRQHDRVAAFALAGYQKCLGSEPTGIRRKPTPHEFATDVGDALQKIYEMVVIKVASLFETFTHCWALNYLLARLEKNEQWCESEQQLSDQLCPVVSSRLPNWRQVVTGIPEVETQLRALPHIFYDKRTSEEVAAPVSPLLNAFSVVEFWREYRNLVIHRSGVVSTAFYDRFSSLYEELRRPYGHQIPPLLRGRALRFTDIVPRAMATTHYRAAARLGKFLANFSDRRRGHIAAPGPEVDWVRKQALTPKPMLISGDHELSYRWVAEPRFAAKIVEKLRAEARQRGMKLTRLPNEFFAEARAINRTPAPRNAPSIDS